MRDLFIKDWGWKLFSLFLAAGIWLTVHKIIEPKTTSAAAAGSSVTYDNLPVLLVSAGANVSEYRLAQPTVSVTVSGPPEMVEVLQANQIRATVDLSDLKTNQDLKRRIEVSVPSRITLISVDPPKVGVIIPPSPAKKP